VDRLERELRRSRGCLKKRGRLSKGHPSVSLCFHCNCQLTSKQEKMNAFAFAFAVECRKQEREVIKVNLIKTRKTCHSIPSNSEPQI